MLGGGGGGGANGNSMFPGFVEENGVHYDINSVPQLQLFGHDLMQHDGGTGTINYMENDHASVVNRPIKRAREKDPIITQQNLYTSLNNNNLWQDDAGNRTLLNPNNVSIGLRLSCDEDEPGSSVSYAYENIRKSVPGSHSLGNTVKLEMDRQTEEFCRYMKLQEETMMKDIRELTQRHTVSLFNTLEKEVNKKLHEKELEITNVHRKNKELEDKIKQVMAEAQTWHYRAKYNESMVNALKSNIQQLMVQGSAQAREGSGDSEVEDAVSGTNNQGIMSSSGSQLPKCRTCKFKQVSVLLLPCRHLCLCIDCEGFIDICPVCQVMKNASVHVYL